MSNKKKHGKTEPPFVLLLPFTLIKWLFILIYKIIYLVFAVITFPIRLILKSKTPKNGEEYEYWCCKELKKKGYKDIHTTVRTGDHGIDIIARSGKKIYAIQCKFYSTNVGNYAVQEAYTGCAYYECDIPVVITNVAFTRQAKAEAEKLSVLLWEHNEIPKARDFFGNLFWRDKNNFFGGDEEIDDYNEAEEYNYDEDENTDSDDLTEDYEENDGDDFEEYDSEIYNDESGDNLLKNKSEKNNIDNSEVTITFWNEQ